MARPMTDDKKVRKWDPLGQDKPPDSAKLDPKDFARMTPEQKVDTIMAMVGLMKQFGGDPREMFKEVIASLPEDQREQIARDPQLKAQLRAFLDAL